MNKCACIYADIDSVGYSDENEVVALADVKCGECFRTISQGEKFWEYLSWESSTCAICEDYIEECGHTENPDDTHVICLDCKSVIDVFFCDGFYFEMVWETVEEHIRNVGDDMLSCDMQALTKRARYSVCDLLECRWEKERE